MLGKLGFSWSKSRTGFWQHSKLNWKSWQNKNCFLSQEKQEIDKDIFSRELEEYAHNLNFELDKGKEIQQNFLPDQLLQPENWEIAAYFHAARMVSGDFYDVFELPGGYIGLVIADVCDKGVGAALFMGLFRSLIRIFSGQTSLQGVSLLGVDFDELESKNIGHLFLENLDNKIDLAQIHALKAIPLTNNYVAQNHWSLNMFATVFFGVLNPETGSLSYINAGHEPLFLLNSGCIKTSLPPTGTVVGALPNMKFGVGQVQLEPDEILIGYTDGVTDARSPEQEFFSSQQLKQLLEQPTNSAADILELVRTNLFAHINHASQFDDITMLAIRRLRSQ